MWCYRMVLALLLCGCTAPHHAVLLTAPRCDDPGMYDIGAIVGEHERLFRRALKDDAVVVHSRTEASRAIERALTPAMMMYSGHGMLDFTKTASELCLAGEHVPVGQLVRNPDGYSMQRSRGPLTLILTTCMSGLADLRSAGREVSIISASSDAVSPDSKFAEAVGRALEATDLDGNCDGLVTDQEAFERLLRELGAYEALGAAVPFNDLRARPRLQRHAMSQLPLPIRSRCGPPSSAPRLANPRGSLELQHELDKQERVAREPTSELPRLDWDYYTIDANPGTPDDVVASLRDALGAIRNCGPKGDRACVVPFPGTDIEAERVARYAMFVEVFRIELKWSYVRAVRLRDGVLLGTRHLRSSRAFEDLIAALPLRVRERTVNASVQRIALDSASADRVPQTWKAVPCTTELVGECFEEKK